MATDRLAFAKRSLAAIDTDLTAAEKANDAQGVKRLATLRAQARETVALAQTRKALIEERSVPSVPIAKTTDVRAAAAQATEAANRFAAAERLQADATKLADAALIKQTDDLVASRAARLESAQQVVAFANQEAEAIAAAAEKSSQAAQAAAAAEKERTEAAKQTAKAIAAAEKEQATAEKERVAAAKKAAAAAVTADRERAASAKKAATEIVAAEREVSSVLAAGQTAQKAITTELQAEAAAASSAAQKQAKSDAARVSRLAPLNALITEEINLTKLAAGATITQAEAEAGLAASKKASAEAGRISKSLTTQGQGAAAATVAGIQAEIVANQQVFETVLLAAKAQEKAAAVANAGRGAVEGLTIAKRELVAADAAVEATAQTLAASLKTTNVGLQEQAADAHAAAVAVAELKAEQVQLQTVQQSQSRTVNRIPLVRAAIDRAQSAGVGDTAAAAARAQLSSAIAAENQAKALVRAAAANETLTLAQRQTIDGLLVEASAFRASSAQAVINTRELNKNATAHSQAARGLGATSAGFLGLRGAVLSSSAPFLIATVALTAFAKAVGSAGQLQQSLNTFQAVAGATADQMASIRVQVQALGADLSLPAISAQDAADALTELSKAGISIKDSQAAARGVLQLATAANISAGEAAKITASQLNAFSLAGTEAERVTNDLAGAAIAAQGEITDFAVAFSQASTVAAQAGINFDQTTTLLTQLAKAGIKGSDAGTSLRVEISRLVPTTKPAIEGFKKLGIEIDNTRSIGDQLPSIIEQFSTSLAKLSTQDQSRVLKDIFGQDAQRAAIVTLTKGSAAYLKLQAEVTATGNAARITDAKAKGLSGAVDGLSSTTSNLATTLGSIVSPAVESVVRALTDMVSAVEAVSSTVAPLVSALGTLAKPFGGGEVVAQIGLVALAAVGVQKALVKVGITAAATTGAVSESAAAQARSEAAVAESVAAANTVAAEQLTLFAAAIPTAAATGAAAVVLAEEEKQAALAITTAVAAEQLVLFGRLAALGGVSGVTAAATKRVAVDAAAAETKIKGLSGAFAKFSLVGFGAGVAGQVAGQAIGGTAGNIIGSAGQGAAFGSFFGLPGAAAGAAAFGGLALLNEAVKSSKKADDEIRKKWNSMTFIEQRTAIENGLVKTVRGPGGGPTQVNTEVERIKRLNLELKPNPDQSRFRTDVIFRPPGTTRDQAVIAARLAGFKASRVPLSPTDPLLAGPKAENFSRAEVGLAPFLQTGPNFNQLLQIQKAKAAGDNKALLEADRVRQAFVKERIAILEKQKNATVNPTVLKTIKANLSSRIAESAQLEEEIQQLLAGSFGFNPKLAKLNLAQIKAQGTKSVQDNLVADRAVVQAYEDILKNKNIHGAALADLRAKLASAANVVTSDQETIATNAATKADEAAQATQIGLERAAAAADNQGAAEAAYIKFLEGQVVKAKGNTLKYQQALSALNAEQQKQKDAIESRKQLVLNLRDARIQTARTAADLTETTADNISVEGIALKAVGRDIDKQQALIDSGKLSGRKLTEAQIVLQELIQKKNGLLGTIKDLKGLKNGGGFSLQDLFKESVNQLQQFGSNVSASVTTPGGARAAVAGDILNQRKFDTSDVFGRALQRANSDVVDKQAKTNELLAGILTAVGGTVPSQNQTNKGKNPYRVTPWQAAVIAGKVPAN